MEQKMKKERIEEEARYQKFLNDLYKGARFFDAFMDMLYNDNNLHLFQDYII